MPKKEPLVKIVTTDDKVRRHIRWERQMVEENPIKLPENPLAIISLPLGRVTVIRGEKELRGMPKQKLYENDIIKTGRKSRVEGKSIDGEGSGEVSERYRFRIGQESEFAVSTENIKMIIKDYEGSVKKGSIWVAAKVAFGDQKGVAYRMPTAVAAIRG